MQALVIFAYHYSNNPQPCSPPAPHASNNSTALQIYAEAESNENELVRFSLPRRNSICGALATNIRRSRVQSKCFCYAEAQQYKWHLVPNIRRSQVQCKFTCKCWKKKNLEIATLSTQFKAYKIEINTQQQLYIAQLVPNNNIVTLPAPRQNEAQR